MSNTVEIKSFKKELARAAAFEADLLQKPPVAISQEHYQEMLDVLPPNHFTNGSFTMSEMTTGNITTMFAALSTELGTHHICKNVRIEGGEITKDTRITLDDFEEVEDECHEISQIEEQIYGEGNDRMRIACTFVMTYLSGNQCNYLHAFQVIQDTGCIYHGSASDVAYDLLSESANWDSIQPLFSYIDHASYLSDVGYEDIAYETWADTNRLNDH
jgi:hypothetical protein|tara:strand:- start:2429 stop:3076 length:648 start_codon:yes stop_codon:yes gene_type:complete